MDMDLPDQKYEGFGHLLPDELFFGSIGIFLRPPWDAGLFESQGAFSVIIFRLASQRGMAK
jgi:hypothetical protein